MNQITIVAHIRAKADQVALVQSELEKMVASTRQEPGCLQYDLHRDNQDPAHFVMLEAWASPEQLQAHAAGQPMQDFQAAVKGAIESFTVNDLTRIG